MTGHLREAVIDLDAIAANTAALRGYAPHAGLMAVVKADAYGHGLLPCARAALAGGATWLATALLDEALALRAAGLTQPVLCWLLGPGDDLDAAVAADVDLSSSAPWSLEAAAAAAARVGRPARVHLKADTGLARSGAGPADWPDLAETARKREVDGLVEVVGVWSHFHSADVVGDPSVDAQLAVFREALAVAEAAGLRPQVRHLANSPAVVTRPDTAFDLTRPGLSLYGLSPIPDRLTPTDLGLRPAMTLRARLVHVRRVAAGQGVSYLHRYVTAGPTTLGLVPVGYADGIPRAATNTGPMLVAGRRRTVAGTVAMDQVVVDVGDDPVAVGDEVVLFGPGDRGEPTAEDWARAAGTISYEIVARIGPRVVRRYVGGAR